MDGEEDTCCRATDSVRSACAVCVWRTMIGTSPLLSWYSLFAASSTERADCVGLHV